MRRSGRKGIVGIEAAIVMIAFVIVASAFAFMVVNMGLTSTQRSKEAIQQGLKEASCPLTLDGSLLLKSDPTQPNNIETIIIPLKTLGVKYVPMWTNETVVSIKIGTKVSVANIYAGINHTINPTGMSFDDIVSLVKNTYLSESFTETVTITGGTGTLSKKPVVRGSLIINVNSSTTLKDDGEGNIINASDSTPIGSIAYDTGTITGVTKVSDGDYTATYQAYTISTTDSKAVLVVENDNGDDSLDFFEKGYLIIELDSSQRAAPRDNILIEIRPEKSAPLTIEFTVPEAIPADAYVTIE
ncbi:MAG: hypothetical protein DRZ76_04585 [Candidatus Nealsonbacteria bacterium]|nr:MAG: hypothetical protein DRZ76_04585 [Candidatus Nealsonbacteria bacterium]